MRSNKIIAGLLVLIGFGSCCNRPAKSKVPEEPTKGTEIKVDTTSMQPIRVMYGPPSDRYRLERKAGEARPAEAGTMQESTATDGE